MMGECKFVRDRFLQYEEGLLLNRERELVQRHLAACPVCKSMIDDMRAVQATLNALPDVAPGEAYWTGFASKLRRRLDLGSQPEPRLLRLPIKAVAAAVMLIAVFAAGFVLGERRGPNEQEISAMVDARVQAAMKQIPVPQTTPVVQPAYLSRGGDDDEHPIRRIRDMVARYLKDRVPGADEDFVSEDMIRYFVTKMSEKHPLLQNKFKYVQVSDEDQ